MFDLRAYLKQATTVQGMYGNEWVIQCECDNDKKRWHLWVNVKTHKGVCYRCKRAFGDAIGVIRFIEGVSLPEAMQRVSDATLPTTRLKDAVAKLLPDEDEPEEEETPVTIEIPDEFVPAWTAKKLPPYFKKRGVTKRDCKRHSIGWCDSGFYANRIIIPIFDIDDELASFVARWMGRPPKGTQKVRYPKGSKIGRVLFNHTRVIDKRTVVITEGVFDALRVGTQAVALFGKNASRYQVKHLIKLGATRRLVVLLDCDARDEAIELAEELAEHCPDVRRARLPKGVKDPGDATSDALRARIRLARRVGVHRVPLPL